MYAQIFSTTYKGITNITKVVCLNYCVIFVPTVLAKYVIRTINSFYIKIMFALD